MFTKEDGVGQWVAVWHTRKTWRVLGFAAISLLMIFITGCGQPSPVVPDRISLDPHASGNGQCALYGESLEHPLQVFVEGAVSRGVLGGKGTRPAARDAEVVFTIENPESGAVFTDNGKTEITVHTDSGGLASVNVRMGNRPGDVYVSATVQTPHGAKSVHFRVIAGVIPIMSAKETATKGTIDQVGLQLIEPDGTPATGIPIFFRVEGNGHGARVNGGMQAQVYTDKEGKALVSWTLGKKIQLYYLSAEILDNRTTIPATSRFVTRAIEFKAMATNKLGMVLQLFGGLAVFIFGMRLMSGGLQRMADKRLKSILQAMTKNRFLAIAVGAGLTAMIQSSSATTVMTVGFINAGLLKLTQAIGVVFGANIGTTITGQIIAFKLDDLAFPAIAVGLVMSMVLRKPALRFLGEAIMGFGLLFLGMTTMSSILKPLKDSPQFISLFSLFDCTPEPGGMVKAPQAFMCIIIGTAATCIIQSSSATVGLVLALASQGLISFYTALPLVLGDNIGTTITAILASLGANRNAKRAALAHTMFNVFGAAYMYVLLFIPLWHGQPLFLGFVDWITPGNAFGPTPENLARHIANAHTFFNVFNVILFLPFIGLMSKVCYAIIPIREEDEKVLKYLEPHLLETPSLAVQQAVNEVAYMVDESRQSINDACLFFHNDGGDNKEREEKKIVARENRIDRLQHDITAYLVNLSRRKLEPEQAAMIPELIHAVNDAERIGDHSESLLSLQHAKVERSLVIPEDAQKEIRKVQDLLNRQFDATLDTLTKHPESARDVFRYAREIKECIEQASESHLGRIESNQCNVASGVLFLDVLSHLERVTDHLVNIAERAVDFAHPELAEDVRP